MNTLTTTSDAKSIHASIFPHLAKRLSDLGNLLDSVSTKISPGSEVSDENISAEVFEAEIISQTTVPAKILAELSKPLYEKVVCDIPFLVLDSTKKLVARQDALSKLRYIYIYYLLSTLLKSSQRPLAFICSTLYFIDNYTYTIVCTMYPFPKYV